MSQIIRFLDSRYFSLLVVLMMVTATILDAMSGDAWGAAAFGFCAGTFAMGLAREWEKRG